uniref:MBD domain-containing protein n=1 Tax=Mesocestoides corti TaxID=53468 RepID=A0A5K3EX38_MESCO
MSVYHSTAGQQSNASGASSSITKVSANTNGVQYPADSTSASTMRNDLSLDYLASVFASNGTIPPAVLQHNHSSGVAASSGLGQPLPAEVVNSLVNATASPNSMDPFAASTLLSSLMYNQQHGSNIAPGVRQQTTPPYAPKAANIALDPNLLAQHALMQAGLANLDVSNHQHQQQQMALALAALLGQPGSNNLMSMQQRRELSSYRGESVDETNASSCADESFSSVLAKLTQGLNQSSSASTPSSSSSSRTPSTAQIQTKETQIPPSTSLNPPEAAPSSSSVSATSSSSHPAITSQMSGLGPRFTLPGAGDNASLTTASFAAAALAALHHQQHPGQLKQAGPKPPSHLPHRSHAVAPTNRESQPHRGRGRPPKSSFAPTKASLDKPLRASASIPHVDNSIADSAHALYSDSSSSIDGTITDVLKRLSDSTDHVSSRKRRRGDGFDKLVSNSASTTTTPSSSVTTATAAAASAPTSKPEPLSHKRARTLGAYADSGYRLPLALGWRRETLVKGVGPGGLLGDVVYISPCGRQIWNIESVREYLRSTGTSILTTEDFTFKSYIRLGDYYECNKDSKGFVKMSEASVNALIATGQETPSGSSRRTPQITFPSSSTAKSSSASQSSPGLAFSAEVNSAMVSSSVEGYSKAFADFPLGLPRFPNLPPQLVSALATQIGSLWSPWATVVRNSAISAAPTSPSSPFSFPFPSAVQNDRSPNQPPSLSNFEDFDRLRTFFTKLVEDQRRLETEKETQLKAELEAQTTKARVERLEHLVEEELRRPVEDLCLLNATVLPTFDRIDGNRMSSQVFSDCIFVLEFLHAFTEAFCIDPETIPSMRCMQAAFVDRDETCLEVINHLIIELLKFAILDPGIPTPRLVTQLLGQRFSEMEVDTNTVTGLLRVFLIGRNGYEDEMSDWLAPSSVDHLTDLSGPRLASLLAFICDELACSSRLISNEVDRTIELQVSLRRDKFNLEAKIRRIRVILARKFGLDHAVLPGQTSGLDEATNKNQPAFLQNVRQPAMQNYDSGDEEELNTVDELEKRIETLTYALNAKQRAIEECSFRLSGVFLGQDRFHRNYFVLGSVGGIYVEGQHVGTREGFSVREVPLVFDADAIVAEIKARRELSITRHFSANANSSSALNSSSMVPRPNPRRSPSGSVTSEKPNMHHDEELVEIKNEEIPAMGMYEALSKTSEEEQDGVEFRCPKVEKMEVEEQNVDGDSVQMPMKLESALVEEELTKEVSKKQKPEESEEPTASQPLDLSTRRASPPPPPPPQPTPRLPVQSTAQESDLAIWQALSEHELVAALESCQLDDTFLTTATLLFATQTGIIDRSAIVGSWTDPSWHVILLFYKLQLLRSVAFETAKKQADDVNALTTALRQLKAWLADGVMEGSSGHSASAHNSNDVHVDDEELLPEVEQFLKEKGIQDVGEDKLQLVSGEVKGDWWRIRGSGQLQTLLAALSPRGIRERTLAQSIQLAEEAVASSIYVDASSVLDLGSVSDPAEDEWKPRLLRVRSRRGKGRGANASNILSSTSSANLTTLSGGGGSGFGRIPTLQSCQSTTNHLDAAVASSAFDACAFRREFDASTASSPNAVDRSIFLGENFERAMRMGQTSANHTVNEVDRDFLDECRFLELVEGLVDRVLSASLQTKGWQAPMKATDDDSIQIIPRSAPKVYRYDYWPLDLARERLLDLEAHVERRYLLPPLSCESRLDVVQTPEESSAEVEGSVCSDSTHDEPGEISTVPHIRRVLRRQPGGADDDKTSDLPGQQGLPLGLLEWRRGTKKADTIADLKRCAMQFEAAIAWDKSIMKVLCQICRRDKNEARLLLCDGCDHGYHTYCFRPPMVSIPDGDWFCYDCVSKATGKCHCFVCGLSKPLGSTPGASESTVMVALDPAHRLVQCTTCSRGAHPSCLRPPLNRLPKRWNCMFCTSTGAILQEKAVSPESNPSRKFQASMSLSSRLELTRQKRLYTKSGAFRSSKRGHKTKSDLVIKKKKGTNDQKRVGRPKGSGRKASPGLKKRGRPRGFYKRASIESGQCNVNDGAEDDDVEEDDEEGDDKSAEEKETRESGDEKDSNWGSSVGISDALTTQKRSATTSALRRHGTGKLRKAMCFAEREFCRRATEDLMKHELSWPFRKPVCCKTVPFYRKVIKRPMDLSTILKRISVDRWNFYSSISEWREDVRLVFKNCQIFNEDDSEIGKAGHELRRYFESNWANASRLPNAGDLPSPIEAMDAENLVASAPSSPDYGPPTCTSSPKPPTSSTTEETESTLRAVDASVASNSPTKLETTQPMLGGDVEEAVIAATASTDMPNTCAGGSLVGSLVT